MWNKEERLNFENEGNEILERQQKISENIQSKKQESLDQSQIINQCNNYNKINKS